MENLIELNKNEMCLIDAGHDGTAYHFGESVGSFCRELAIGILSAIITKGKK